MSATNGDKVGTRLSDQQKWIMQNFLVNRREQIIKEKQTFDAIAATLEKPLGVRPTRTSIANSMRVVNMYAEYSRCVLGVNHVNGIALHHARTTALGNAVKKIAKEIGVDISAELGQHFTG